MLLLTFIFSKHFGWHLLVPLDRPVGICGPLGLTWDHAVLTGEALACSSLSFLQNALDFCGEGYSNGFWKTTVENWNYCLRQKTYKTQTFVMKIQLFIKNSERDRARERERRIYWETQTDRQRYTEADETWEGKDSSLRPPSLFFLGGKLSSLSLPSPTLILPFLFSSYLFWIRIPRESAKLFQQSIRDAFNLPITHRSLLLWMNI